MTEIEDVRIVRVLFANVGKTRFCDCQNAQPGIINVEASAHEPNCRFRKKIVTGKYSVDTELSLDNTHDGYNLGVALTD